MRIISKYKDYYDGVQAYGQDLSTVYHRNTQIIDVPNSDGIDKYLRDQVSYHNVTWIRKIRGIQSDIFLTKAIIGFCGKLNVIYSLQDTDKNSKIGPAYFNNRDELILYIKQNEKELCTDDLKSGRGISYKEYKKMTWIEFIEEFEQINVEKNEIFHAIKKPIFLYPHFVLKPELMKKYNWVGKFHWEENKIITDPNLKELGFQKIKDAYQCYQDIEQYLNGVLGNIEKDDDTRTDIEKVRSHGFDDKYGFRTRKK